MTFYTWIPIPTPGGARPLRYVCSQINSCLRPPLLRKIRI